MIFIVKSVFHIASLPIMTQVAVVVKVEPNVVAKKRQCRMLMEHDINISTDVSLASAALIPNF